MSESSPHDDIEMWKGHPDCSMDESRDILKTPDGSDIGYFADVDLRYPDYIKEK